MAQRDSRHYWVDNHYRLDDLLPDDTSDYTVDIGKGTAEHSDGDSFQDNLGWVDQVVEDLTVPPELTEMGRAEHYSALALGH